MSGKTSSAQVPNIPARSFYGESPPKRSRLLEGSSGNISTTVRPAIKVHKDNLIKPTLADCKASNRSLSVSPELKELDRQLVPPQVPATLPRSVTSPTPQAQYNNNHHQEQQPQAECEAKPMETSGPSDKTSTESPVPLKNLGNTCYENSIIQCLFSLEMFMVNFEESMQRAKNYVLKHKLATNLHLADPDSSSGIGERNNDIPSSTARDQSKITDNDVRFRVAQAFEKLYRTYVSTQSHVKKPVAGNQVVIASDSDDQSIKLKSQQQPQQEQEGAGERWSTDPSGMAINNNWQAALSFCKPSVDTSNGSGEVTSRSNDNLQSAATSSSSSDHNQESKTRAMIPIALTSSSSPAPSIVSTTAATLTPAPQNEQSEIESKLEDLKSAVGERSAQFNSTNQQDASEFFYHVIDSIQEFYQGLPEISDDDNPVTNAFELELDHLIKCPKCHHSNMLPSEKHRTLPLPLPHVNTENNREDCSEEARGAPTPPTSDLGLDSPESNTSDESKCIPEGDELTLLDLEHNSKTSTHNNSVVFGPEPFSSERIAKQQVGKQSPTPSSSPTATAEPATHPQAQTSSKQPQSSNQIQQKQYTLTDALNNYFKDDLLDYPCSQPDCDSKQRTKRCLIRKLPQVLFISLARYSYTCKKSLEEIEAPFELTVPFRENRSPAHSPSSHRDYKEEEEDNKYQLVAIVCHLGSSLNAGHYTSYVHNQSNGSWYWCDDESITKVQESDVAKDANKNGYCFFYIRKSIITPSPNVSTNYKLSERTQLQRTHNGAISGTSMPDSSVVMTPESSPTSSPTPSVTSLDMNDMHANHKLCGSNQSHDIDDWS